MSPDHAILVVDDSEDHRFIALTEIKRLKLAKRVRLEEAASGEDALQKVGAMLRAGLQVLVFSDYRMPKMGGVELVRAIRNQWPDAPVQVVIYSSTDQGVGEESIMHGADAFMVKPMELQQFRNELTQAVTRFLREE